MNAEFLPAVFLDRDGTINSEKNYVYRVEDFEWIEGSLEAIRLFNLARYRVVVVTNQSGVARGLYSTRDVHKLHDYIQSLCHRVRAHVDAFLYCPHHPEAVVDEFRQMCSCRKPGVGMIRRAMSLLAIDLQKSWVIGDGIPDMEMAKAAGVRKILVRTGHGEQTALKSYDFQIEYLAENLYDASTWLLGNPV